MTSYQEFLKTKRIIVATVGKDVKPEDVNPTLFPFQRDLVVWACHKGRAAIFADTGLGKTRMQLEWARLMGVKTLILAPLSVAKQTIREGEKIGVKVSYSRDGSADDQITITNYEMVEHFKPDQFEAVILDESSILKALDGKTRQQLTEMFAQTPYRLCCTATPAPNDIAELGNHSEFLGVMNRVDMLATFFVHESNQKNADGWRLKGHAEDSFYRWLASWGMSIRKPSDLGYSDEGYNLPPLNVQPLWVDYEYVPEGQLFNTGLKGITDRTKVRKGTLEARCDAIAEMVKTSSDQWIIWVGLNDEGDTMAKLLLDAVQISGSQSPEEKANAIDDFQQGKFRVLITKTTIAGFGVNLQNCHKQAFVGMSDSWEQYYQAVRRSWRFGQQSSVDIYIALSHIEQPVLENIKRKEAQALAMSQKLIEQVQAFEKEELHGEDRGYEYQTDTVKSDRYTLMLGDSAERIKEIDSDSVHLSIYSPPFMSLYAYSPTERDLGNSRGASEFFSHYKFIIQDLLRVTVPGRLTCVHVAQVPATKVYDGYIGLKDFRGDVIRAYEAEGWIYHGEICVDKDPQAQAIRTHSKSLLFVTLDKDSSWLRPALADYVLIFRKPGDNPVPITPLENGEMSREDWINWARPIWYDIRETETLNVIQAREDKDERHICPLQLPLIQRCIKLWSNPGELVLDPFGGLGSTGYEAVKAGRRAVMCELKPSYFEQMKRNMIAAAKEGVFQRSIFDELAQEPKQPVVDIVEELEPETEPATADAEKVVSTPVSEQTPAFKVWSNEAADAIESVRAMAQPSVNPQRPVDLEENVGDIRVKVLGAIVHMVDGKLQLRYRCVVKELTEKGGFKEIKKEFLQTADEAELWFYAAVATAKKSGDSTAEAVA